MTPLPPPPPLLSNQALVSSIFMAYAADIGHETAVCVCGHQRRPNTLLVPFSPPASNPSRYKQPLYLLRVDQLAAQEPLPRSTAKGRWVSTQTAGQ